MHTVVEVSLGYAEKMMKPFVLIISRNEKSFWFFCLGTFSFHWWDLTVVKNLTAGEKEKEASSL